MAARPSGPAAMNEAPLASGSSRFEASERQACWWCLGFISRLLLVFTPVESLSTSIPQAPERPSEARCTLAV